MLSPDPQIRQTWLQNIRPATALSLILVFVTTLLLISLIAITDANLFFKEGYGVEQLTVALYALAIILWFSARPAAGDWHLPLILALMAMRELDFDKRFTEVGLLKSHYYLRDAPISAKLTGIALLLVVFVSLARLVWRNLGPWLRALRARRLDAWLVFVAGFGVFIAKAIDGIDRKLAPYDITFSHEALVRFGRVEEVLEMVFVILICQAIVIFAHRFRASY
jgi:hypothetical protein